MKQLFSILMAALLICALAGCSDSYDDGALRDEIARLEKRLEAAETVLAAYAKNLSITAVEKITDGYLIRFSDGSSATIHNGKNGADGKDGANGSNGKDGDTWISSVTVGEREVTFVMTDGRSFSIPLATPVTKLQQIVYVPDNVDGMATVRYTSPSDATVTLSFLISPREELAALTEQWATYFTLKAVATANSRTTELTDLPITAFAADAASGIVEVTASAANLAANFFVGVEAAAVSLVVSDGVTTLASEFVPLWASAEHFPANELRYTTTNGATATPKKAVGAGITVVENSYENGVGRMLFSENLTEIGEQAFAAHATLRTVELPHGLVTVGKKSFNNCTKLVEATIPVTVSAIKEYAFGGSALQQVRIFGTPTIGQFAFSNCKSLAAFYGPSATADHRGLLDGSRFAAYAPASGLSYAVPEGVETIGATAFANCGEVTDVTLPAGITSVETYGFYYCFALSSINLPEGLQSIGEYAFMGCRGLRELTLPSTIETIAAGAFRGCEKVTVWTVKAATPPVLASGVFAGCNAMTEIRVPASAVELYKAADGWANYADKISAIQN